MRSSMRWGGWLSGVLAAGCLPACGDETPGPDAPVGADVARDRWVDQAEVLPGDGRSDFESVTPVTGLRRPPYREPSYEVPSAPIALDAERLYAVSGYAGLVIADVSGPTAPVALGRLPIAGSPFEVNARDGMVLALINDTRRGCAPSDSIDCSWVEGTTAGALLIDARDPATPVVVAERSVPGSIAASHRVGDVLYVVSRKLSHCSECWGPSELESTITALDLRDPLAIGQLEQLSLPVGGVIPGLDESVPERHYRFIGDRLFVATPGPNQEGGTLQIIELQGGLRFGAAAPYGGGRFEAVEVAPGAVFIESQTGLSDGTLAYRYLLASPAGLAPLGAAFVAGPNGAELDLALQAGAAAALSADRRSLLAFDLVDPAAPRLAGSLVLPFAAALLVAAGPGQMLAVGPDPNAADSSRIVLVDVRNPAAPVVASELEWQGWPGVQLFGQPRFDAASGSLLLPYRVEESAVWMQVIGTSGGQLSFGTTTQNPDTARYVIAGGRLFDATFARIASRPLDVEESPATLTIAWPADAVRVLGATVARIGGAPSAELLLQGSDLLAAPGTDLGNLVGVGRSGTWRRQVLAQGDSVILAHEPLDAVNPRLSVYAFGVADSGAVSSLANIELPGSAREYRDSVQTPSSVIVPRASRWLPGFPPNDVAPAGYDDSPSLSYQLLDTREPNALRVAASIELPEALVRGGHGRGAADTIIDAPWGWQAGTAGPLVTGNLVVSQHWEPSENGYRFFLDRLDTSDPAAPSWLPAVNIPGEVLSVDGETNSLITLETLAAQSGGDRASDCGAAGYSQSFTGQPQKRCSVVWRSLSGLSLDGDVAIRRSQLLLDDTRRTLLFAVSGDQVFYVTEPLDSEEGININPSAAGVQVTLERVRVAGGQLERLPSVDISGQHSLIPRYWEQVVARGNRVYSLSRDELAVVDFGVEPPRLSRHTLPAVGCAAFDVAGDTGYCASGASGIVTLDLAAPR